MKLEYRITLGTFVFLGVVAAIYWFWSTESTGTVLLGFGGAAYALLFGFILLQYLRRHKIPRPEDRDDARMEDGAGEIHFFPAASIWPVGLGLGFVLVAVGLVYGPWFWVIGFGLLLGAVIGFNVEAEAR